MARTRGLLLALCGAAFAMAGAPAAAQVVTFTLTSPGYDYVFQRDFGGTQGSAALAGTYAGPATDVACEVVDPRTNTPVRAWTTVATLPASGSAAPWSGTLSQWPVSTGADGKPYWAEIVCQAGGAQASASNVAMGMIILHIGQSNKGRMTWQANGTVKASPFIGLNTGKASSDSWVSLAANPTLYGTIAPGGPPDGDAELGDLLVSTLRFPVSIVNSAKGDTRMIDWTSGYSGPETPKCHCLDNAIRQVKTYAGGKVEIVAFQQGESDAYALTPTDSATRYAFLDTLAASLSSQIIVPTSRPWLVMNTLASTPTTDVDDEAWTEIRWTDFKWTRANPRIAVWGGTLIDVLNWPGSIHWQDYTSEAKGETLGILRALGLKPRDAAGPTIQSWSISGSHLVITYKLNGGTRIGTLAGGPVSDAQFSADGGLTWTAATTPLTVTGYNRVEADFTQPVTNPQNYRLRTDWGAAPDVSNAVVGNNAFHGRLPVAQPSEGALPPG